jgi:hypothetical protein
VSRQVNVRPTTTTTTEEQPPTNATTPLPPGCILTTAGLLCPPPSANTTAMPATNQTTAVSPVLSDPVILLTNINNALAPVVEPLLQNLTLEGVITANQSQTISSVIDRFQANPNSNISSSEATEICNVLVNSTEPSTVEGIVDACESTQRPQASIFMDILVAIIGWLVGEAMEEISDWVSTCAGLVDPIPERNGGGCCPRDKPYWNADYEECTRV